MALTELLLLAIGLSMDAFAVSICKGLAIKKIRIKDCCIVGLWFGSFQALIPTIGYFLGSKFSKYINEYDHWIALVLLSIIGINMLREAFSKNEDEVTDNSLSFKTMFVMAIATSIDALAVGVAPLSFEPLNKLAFSVASIGIITFLVSAAGVKIGNRFGCKYKSKAEITGGVILILLGIKILLEHLGVL